MQSILRRGLRAVRLTSLDASRAKGVVAYAKGNPVP